MNFLIRFIVNDAAGGVQHNDKRIDVPAITIGRATDQVLHLQDRNVRLQHASIEARGDAVHIRSHTLSGVMVNGHSTRDKQLNVEDTIEIGANILRVIEPPTGSDFAISFELRREVEAGDIDVGWGSDEETAQGISKRTLSWVAAAAVLLFAFLLPGISLIGGGTAAITRGSPMLPDDSWWLAGPVHSKHSSIASECDSCHATVFTRVRDAVCEECHSVDRHVGESYRPILGVMRCADCHLEHNEPPALVNRNQDLCADCHGDVSVIAPMPTASDFLHDHPEFKVSLLMPDENVDGETVWTTNRVSLRDVRQGERSRLKFNHAVHVDAAGVMAPDGKRSLQCADCHVPEPGGGRMQPIEMAVHCTECHTLSFDPDDPARTVPHGDTGAVLQVLVEYYSAKLLGDDPAAVAPRLQRPGQVLTKADRDKVAAAARVQARQVAADLFERRACVNCHEVTRDDAAPDLPWHVQSVRLTRDFLPQAKFSHAAHENAVMTCDGCHDASTSEAAADILIPGQESCTACHGSALASGNSDGQIPSTCVLCHNFHFDEHGSYR